MNGEQAAMGDVLSIEVTLENTGDRSTMETVILYSQDRVATITPSVDKLRPTNKSLYPLEQR